MDVSRLWIRSRIYAQAAGAFAHLLGSRVVRRNRSPPAGVGESMVLSATCLDQGRGAAQQPDSVAQGWRAPAASLGIARRRLASPYQFHHGGRQSIIV